MFIKTFSTHVRAIRYGWPSWLVVAEVYTNEHWRRVYEDDELGDHEAWKKAQEKAQQFVKE